MNREIGWSTESNLLWNILQRLKRINSVGAGGGVWGAITGTLSAQTDLQSALNAKQDTLTSGTNIKTINGSSVLGSGDLTVSNQIKLSSQTLAFASWTLVGDYYEYTFSNVNIVAAGFITFTPNNASNNEVSTCRLLPQIDAASGSCKFYSLFPPQTDIVGEIIIFIL